MSASGSADFQNRIAEAAVAQFSRSAPGAGAPEFVSQSDFLFEAGSSTALEMPVEVRDQAVQKSYASGGKACASDTVDLCCGTSACGTPNDCIRWTTGTVEFQP